MKKIPLLCSIIALTLMCQLKPILADPDTNPDENLTDTPPCPSITSPNTCTDDCGKRRHCNTSGKNSERVEARAYAFRNVGSQLTGTTGSVFYCCKAKVKISKACDGGTPCTYWENCMTNGDVGPLNDTQCKNENGLCGMG